MNPRGPAITTANGAAMYRIFETTIEFDEFVKAVRSDGRFQIGTDPLKWIWLMLNTQHDAFFDTRRAAV